MDDSVNYVLLGIKCVAEYKAKLAKTCVPPHSIYPLDDLQAAQINPRFGFGFTSEESDYALMYITTMSRMGEFYFHLKRARTGIQVALARAKRLVEDIAASVNIEPTIYAIRSHLDLFDADTRQTIQDLIDIREQCLLKQLDLDKAEVNGEQINLKTCGLAESLRRKISRPELIESVIEDYFRQNAVHIAVSFSR